MWSGTSAVDEGGNSPGGDLRECNLCNKVNDVANVLKKKLEMRKLGNRMVI